MHVRNASDDERAWLHAYLSCPDVDAKHKAEYVAARVRAAYVSRGYDPDDPDDAAEIAASIARNKPDDRLRQFDRKRSVFPTGLLPLVRKAAPGKGFEVNEVDTREELPRVDLEGLDAEPMTLRPYQVDAVGSALVGPTSSSNVPSWTVEHADPGRGIIWVPTGGGKSRMAVAIAHATPGVWLFMVHRSHLADDVRNRWDTTAGVVEGCAAGLIGAGEWSEGRRFTCATLQTLHAHLDTARFRKLAESVTGVMVDEAHVAPAATFLEVIHRFERARFKIGMSGTPLARGDKKGQIAVGALGPVVYRVKAQHLIDRGYLTQPTIRVVPVLQDEYRDSWPETYEDLVVSSAHRNGAVAQCAIVCEKPGMVFVESIEHGYRLLEFLRAHKLNCEFVYGDTSKHLRKRAVRELARGDLDLLIATRVFNEGVDIPCLRAVVMAAAGRSEIAALQRVGRALRVEDGKAAATIYEIGDKGNVGLNDQAKDRLRAYQREGYPIVVDRDIWPEAANPTRELHRAWEAMLVSRELRRGGCA